MESIDREEDGTVLRDLRTGERFTVRTDCPLRELEAGSRWCLRVVPDGVGHQVLGGRFAVAAGSEDEVLALCDRAEPIEICAYAGSVHPSPGRSRHIG